MAATSSLAVLFLVVLVTSAAVPATAGGKYSGAKMVILHGPGTRVGGGAAGARSNKWQQHYRRLEEEVAPEFGGLLGAGDGGISYGALVPDKPACEKGNHECAAKGPGQPYTRGCTYKNQCPH